MTTSGANRRLEGLIFENSLAGQTLAQVESGL